MMVNRKILVGTSLFATMLGSSSICHSAEQLKAYGQKFWNFFGNEESVQITDFNHDKWEIKASGLYFMDHSDIGLNFTLDYKYKIFPKGFKWPDIKPACSILMQDGSQLDYIPGTAAIWYPKDRNSKKPLLLTGAYKETGFSSQDLYSYSARNFAKIIMNTIKRDDFKNPIPANITKSSYPFHVEFFLDWGVSFEKS